MMGPHNDDRMRFICRLNEHGHHQKGPEHMRNKGILKAIYVANHF